jgi:IgA Peptidase M64
MDTKTVILVAVLLLAVSAFLAYRYQGALQTVPFVSKLVSSEEALVPKIPRATIYTPPETVHQGGLNLVFYADHYVSPEEFESDVSLMTEEIKTIEPWKSYAYFNIYKIFPATDTTLCAVKIENERKPVLRCEVGINTYFEKFQLSNAKFIVMSRQDFQSWANVRRAESSGIFFSVPTLIQPSEKTTYGYLFLHLLGHAFGLRDEEKYVIAQAGQEPNQPKGPNCAPDIKTAEGWWGSLAKKFPDRVGYYHTCAGSDTYIKPTQGSLMNLGDLSNFTPDYGPVSEEYLTKVLDYCFSQKRYKVSDDPNFFGVYPELTSCVDQ